MAIIKRGILGGMSGKIANVVGGSWKGIAYVRALPLSVANPNSAAQKETRGAFAHASNIARYVLASVIHPFWNRLAQRMSGYNKFISDNFKAFDKNGFDDESKFQIVVGSLPGIENLAVTSSHAGTNFDLTWDNNSSEPGANSADELVVFIATEDAEHKLIEVGSAVRIDAAVTIQVPADFPVGSYIVSVGFANSDGICSNSVTIPESYV